jgi:hypothetical protein
MAARLTLFGQDQFVFTRDAQQVALAGVLDLYGGVAAQNFLTPDAWSSNIAVGGCGGERGLSLGFHDESKCKREWVALLDN